LLIRARRIEVLCAFFRRKFKAAQRDPLAGASAWFKESSRKHLLGTAKRKKMRSAFMPILDRVNSSVARRHSKWLLATTPMPTRQKAGVSGAQWHVSAAHGANQEGVRPVKIQRRPALGQSTSRHCSSDCFANKH
jgi:hypothetical protein